MPHSKKVQVFTGFLNLLFYMKYKGTTIILWLLFFAEVLHAVALPGRIDKAFQSLEAYNYFDARVQFQKAAKNFPCISSFGLSIIFYRKDNPFHNADSAYAKINEAIKSFDLSDKQESKKLQELKIGKDSLLSTQNAILLLAYKNAIAAGDVKSLNHFIEVYNISPDVSSASHFRDSVAFAAARKENSSESYQQYMMLYPGSHLFSEAKVRYDKALYDESVFDGKESSYAKFAEAYPQSPHANDAMRKVYEMVTGNSIDPEVYRNFIQKYPANYMVEDAWQRIYDLNVITYDEKSIRAFQAKYPDYPFQEKLEQDIDLTRLVLLPFKEQGLIGLMGVDGQTVVEPKYDFIGKFNDGIAAVSANDKMGYISKSGEEIIPPFFDDAEDFHNSLAVVGDGSKYGVINRNGKMIVPLSYLEIGDFSEGMAAAFDGKLYGYISRSGNTVIPFLYQSASEFNNGMAICQDNIYFGTIDKSHKVIVPFKYDAIEWFDSDKLKFTQNERVGLVKTDGTTLLPGSFDEIGPFADGRAVVIRDNKLGYSDASGNIVISLIYDAGKGALLQSGFKQGLATVRKQNKSIVIDTAGKVVINAGYSDMIFVDDSLLAFKQKGLWGIRTIHSNKILVAPKYNQIESCKNGICVVVLKGKAGVIDVNGKIMIPLEYESLLRLESGLFIGQKSGKYGVVEGTNQVIIPFVYDRYNEKEEGFVEFSNASNSCWLDVQKWHIITRN